MEKLKELALFESANIFHFFQIKVSRDENCKSGICIKSYMKLRFHVPYQNKKGLKFSLRIAPYMLKQRKIREVVVSGININLQDNNNEFFTKKFSILGFYPLKYL